MSSQERHENAFASRSFSEPPGEKGKIISPKPISPHLLCLLALATRSDQVLRTPSERAMTKYDTFSSVVPLRLFRNSRNEGQKWLKIKFNGLTARMCCRRACLRISIGAIIGVHRYMVYCCSSGARCSPIETIRTLTLAAYLPVSARRTRPPRLGPTQSGRRRAREKAKEAHRARTASGVRKIKYSERYVLTSRRVRCKRVST